MRAIVSRPLVVVLLASVAPCALAGDLYVPADYSTIQAAIDAAVDGDTVLVAPGTYFEHVDFKGRAITVQSTDGTAVTTIDGSLSGSCVRFVSGEGNASVLRAFTLTNGGVVGYTGYRGGGVQISNSSPTIEANVIVGNYAQNGAGIDNVYSSAVIRGNTIAFNFASGQGGGIGVDTGSAPLIVNNIVFGNTSTGPGGGVWCYSSSPLIADTTIVGNSDAGACYGSSVTILNSIVWDNQGTQLQGGTFTISYSDVQGGWTGTGNIDTDPLFADPANGDFHLSTSSPCIDAGDDSAPSLPTTDFEGEPRIIGAHVDMGADEATRPPQVLSVSPRRTKYDTPASVTISGASFSLGAGTSVSVGTASASNVIVIDDATITCDLPSGSPGPADVVVSNSIGSGTLAGGFVYTPAVTIEGDTTIGSSITIHYLCDPGDGIFAVYGLPPAVSVPTPPFDGDLAIVPFHYFFYVTTWPFDSFDVPATIPNDPALIGVDVLLQSLIGPQLTKPPKVGTWTNCAVLSIR